MSKDAPPPDLVALGASPTRITSADMRIEMRRAAVWIAMVGLTALAVHLAHSLLVIFGALVFAAIIDGGARLLGRVLRIGRVWRVMIVLLAGVAFTVWLTLFAGSQISQEAAQFPEIIEAQSVQFLAWLDRQGFQIDIGNVQGLIGQALSGFGTLTRALGGILGAITTVVLVIIIGVYVALEPRLYERGVAWMLPNHRRADFHILITRMAFTMRRLMFGRLVGMVFEGVLTYIMLASYGVPMAALLSILTGLLAFIPNIGAFISGILMVLVGFSGGYEMGLYTIFVYFLVQTFDGYVVIPLIARKTVDLAPALVLAMQLIMGILFGIAGLFLADPLLAMIKVALEQRSEKNALGDAIAAGPKPPPPPAPFPPTETVPDHA